MDYLSAWTDLREVEILCEYPPKRVLPLKRPALVIGLDGIDLSPAGLGSYLGREPAGLGEIVSLYGTAAIVTLRMDLYLPGADGNGCHRLYEALCVAMTQQSTPFGLLRLWCEPLRYDSSAGAQRLTARAAFRAAFTGRETQSAITQYHVRSEVGDQPV